MAGFSLGLSRLVAQRPSGTGIATATPDTTGKVWTVGGLRPGSTATFYGAGVSVGTTTVDSTGKATWTFASVPAAPRSYDGTVTGSASAILAAPTNPATSTGSLDFSNPANSGLIPAI